MAESLRVLKERGMVKPVDEQGHPRPMVPARRWTLTELGRMFADGPAPGPHPDGEHESGVVDKAAVADEEEHAPLHASKPPLFGLSRHQSYLLARVEGRDVPILLDALAEGEQGVEAGFVARLDGDAHGYYFFFDARLGARPAEALSAAFRATGIDVDLGVVADVRSLDELVRDARAAMTGAHRARQQRQGGLDAGG